ncbi:hypothetical protein HYT25_01905 [Candidatus Pacearchaeota archaeon]|nr:hypothetical protein [Candidatus Pacearchaeota archaeon]
MLVKVLGLVDLIIGMLLVFLSYFNPPSNVLISFSIIAFAKSSLGMLRDFGSWIDFSAGILLGIAILINIPLALSIIVGLLVLQKGVFSFF